ncbi:P27 family phage terminase small subunit [Thermodesulfobacteriota bacterium]
MEIEPRKEWLEAVSEFYRAALFERELALDEMEQLTTTCDRLQRFHLARLQIETEGMTFTSDTGVIKTHPLLVIEREAYTAFLKGCKQLNLKTPEEKRP